MKLNYIKLVPSTTLFDEHRTIDEKIIYSQKAIEKMSKSEVLNTEQLISAIQGEVYEVIIKINKQYSEFKTDIYQASLELLKESLDSIYKIDEQKLNSYYNTAIFTLQQNGIVEDEILEDIVESISNRLITINNSSKRRIPHLKDGGFFV